MQVKSALGEPTRLMDLGEEDLLGRPFEGPPQLDPPLQAAELDVGEPTGEAALKVEEEGLGLEARVEPEQSPAIRARHPGMGPPGSARYGGFVADWGASRSRGTCVPSSRRPPARSAALASVSSVWSNFRSLLN